MENIELVKAALDTTCEKYNYDKKKNYQALLTEMLNLTKNGTNIITADNNCRKNMDLLIQKGLVNRCFNELEESKNITYKIDVDEKIKLIANKMIEIEEQNENEKNNPSKKSYETSLLEIDLNIEYMKNKNKEEKESPFTLINLINGTINTGLDKEIVKVTVIETAYRAFNYSKQSNDLLANKTFKPLFNIFENLKPNNIPTLTNNIKENEIGLICSLYEIIRNNEEYKKSVLDARIQDKNTKEILETFNSMRNPIKSNSIRR